MRILNAFSGKRIDFEDLDLQFILLNQIKEYFPVVSNLLRSEDVIAHSGGLIWRYRPTKIKGIKTLT